MLERLLSTLPESELRLTQTEAYYFSKELISDFYKQRFPLSQHPNFLVINYPTKAYIGNQVAKMALVCESIDEDVMTLRGSLLLMENGSTLSSVLCTWVPPTKLSPTS